MEIAHTMPTLPDIPLPIGVGRGNGGGLGADRTALVIHTLADIAAGFLALWILLYMLDANQANVFVDFVHGAADWLAGWSQDIFTMDTESVRVFFNYALPAGSTWRSGTARRPGCDGSDRLEEGAGGYRVPARATRLAVPEPGGGGDRRSTREGACRWPVGSTYSAGP
ncbi:hypothetical protein BJY27_008709 [Streptomyces rapamycinicus]|uniref:Uncharacterized protein n=1 Tax=Streptomyces rapamycinicus TaxID=1226757 RepID=A0ABR6LZ78_9ACTN|nr:hypothetical protein [Streptomyces rapamycinicus]